MPILIVTPHTRRQGGAVEQVVIPITLSGGGTVEQMQGILTFCGGMLDQVVPHIRSSAGVVGRVGISIAARGGVAARAAVFVRCTAGVVEVLALTAALTQEFYAFCLNTRTGGAAEYANFPFTSLFRVGARFYGITATGLHELTGNSDNGAEIEGVIVSGPSDFGTDQVKLIPTAYAHMSGALQVSTRVDEGEEWSDPYDAEQDLEGIRAEYISMARGEKGVYIRLKIEGTDLTLTKFEQNFVPTGRRRQ